MTTFLAGMRATADRMNDHTLEDSTTSGLVAATNFSVGGFSGRKVSGVTTVECNIEYTGAGINVTNPGDNITDTAMATLPSGWRPPELINALWSNGFVHGECTISTAGVLTMRTTLNDITTGTFLRVTSAWISEND